MLPAWPDGSVATLATAADDGAPHAIPVSAALADGDDAVLLGLAARRTALAHLRARPRAALLVLARGVAVTLHGRAEDLGPLDDAPRVVAVRLAVERVQDHLHPQMVVDAGVRWTWTDGDAAARDAAVVAGLRAVRRR